MGTAVSISYAELEEAFAHIMKKKHKWKVNTDYISGCSMSIPKYDYAYKKNEDGREVVDRANTTCKTEYIGVNYENEFTFDVDSEDENA